MTLEQARQFLLYLRRQQQLEAEKQRHIEAFRAQYEGVIGRRAS